MRIFLFCLSLAFLGAQSAKPAQPPTQRWASSLPVFDHVVIVVEENKYFEQVIGSADAPYINGVLVTEGATLTRMFAEEHNSEGNYFWLFSGSNQGVGFHDVIPDKKNSPHYPFLAGNLGQELIKKGLTFKGYSEDLPEDGSTVSFSGHYARKHVPWISFGNIPNTSNPDSLCNLRFDRFPKDFSQLPTVAIVVPNLVHDMHDPPNNIGTSVRNGDAWLKTNIGPYYEWAKSHNSLLIVTFDENADSSGYTGLTNPASKNRDIKNRIPTIIAGAHIKHGTFAEGKGVTHVNLLRTIEAMYRLERSGGQQKNAARYGISANKIVVDVVEH